MTILSRIKATGITTVGLALIALCTSVSAQNTLFSEAFPSSELSDPMNWEPVAGPNGSLPCLTARDGISGVLSLFSGSQISGCKDKAIDGKNFGALRLTKVAADEVAIMQYINPISTANGLDITFKFAQYGPNGGKGGEGIVFFLKDGANSFTSPLFANGALGYASYQSKPGIPGGLVGIGFDRGGDFGTSAFGSANCAAGNTGQNSIAVRGSDTSAGKDGSAGFCFLGGTANGVSYSGQNRTEATRSVRIAIDPVGTANPKMRIYISGADLVIPSTPTLVVTVPAEYMAARSVKFGFSSANTLDAGNHEVWDVKITSAVSDTSFRTRYSGNGWFVGDQRTRVSFGFNYQEGTRGVTRGSVIWALDDTYRFKGDVIRCNGSVNTGTAVARGELIQKVGEDWISLGVQEITFTFTPSYERNKKLFYGTFSYSFANFPLADQGSLGNGSIKIYRL